MSRKDLDELKEQIPLRDYLEAHDWRPMRRLSRGRWMGLCPLHADRQPSFLMDPGKDLFYCYGCGRGGDVIRFAELYHQVQFPQALALLHQWRGGPPLLPRSREFLSHAVTGSGQDCALHFEFAGQTDIRRRMSDHNLNVLVPQRDSDSGRACCRMPASELFEPLPA